MQEEAEEVVGAERRRRKSYLEILEEEEPMQPEGKSELQSFREAVSLLPTSLTPISPPFQLSSHIIRREFLYLAPNHSSGGESGGPCTH